MPNCGCWASLPSPRPKPRCTSTARFAIPPVRTAQGATVFAEGGRGQVTAVSDINGRFELDYPVSTGVLTLRATARSMESDSIQISAPAAANDIDLTLHPSVISQQITVTTTRSSIDLPATANTVYALTPSDLANYPATVLDDKLRQQAGFELFRRSSSRVQNPTSQGISLRGLGSTAASRTLVLQDNVSMNDPFGGWIHWDEIPAEAVEAVNIATGGGSDLYGSSALGGVIDVVPARPTTGRFDIGALGGGQDISSLTTRADLGNAAWRQLLAADSYRTAGYIPTAPSVAGPVDVPANVHYQSARAETDRIFANSNRAFLIGNMLNEARGNGTPLQTNATRLWRYIGADDWNAGSVASGRVRLFGSDEGYRQSFSSINPARTVETLTRLQRVRTQELGASADTTLSLSPIAFVFGMDARDIRATDNETPIASNLPNGVADTSARQRFIGGFAEALATGHAGLFRNTSAALSLRLDSASNLSTPDHQPNPPSARNHLHHPQPQRVHRQPAPRHRSPNRLHRNHPRVGLSRLSHPHHERALPHRPGRRGNHSGQLAASLRARHRMGGGRNLRLAIRPDRPLQHLLLDRDQPPRLRRPHLQHRNVHPRQTRKPRPDPLAGHRTPP